MSSPGGPFHVERHPLKIWDSLSEIAIESRETLRTFYKIKASYQFPPEPKYDEIVIVAKNSAREPVAAVSIENRGSRLYFYKLGVRKEHRRRGLARLLVQEAIAC